MSQSSGSNERGVTNFEQRVGHPPGLFMLFFAEMWERFSYYGMRALLVFYMTKGFLGFGDTDAYHTYGAYSSLVYMTPFIGGILADRILGPRWAVVFGGLLMASGHLLMTIETGPAFFTALALLICGNGFFKPNISTMVGSLYGARNEAKRDGGFTIFYMGINLGAAMAPLLCGYIGETYGWHYGFGLATAGMIIGLAVFVAPSRVTQLLIGVGALAAAGGLVNKILGHDFIAIIDNGPIAAALLVAAGFAIWALQEGALPPGTGAPPTTEGLRIKQIVVVAITLLVAVPGAALLVQNSKVAGAVLTVFGAAAMLFLFVSALRSAKVERERIFMCLVMFFFSTLFWAFFEQAGSSMNNFADRNVDRVSEAGVVASADVGKTLEVEVNQEQLGYPQAGKPFTMTDLDKARTDKHLKQQWLIGPEHVGMKLGGTVVPASEFQAANPAFILLFGPLFTILWAYLAARRLEPSVPAKFAWAFVQLSAGFAVLWWGASQADARGMVGAGVLLAAYLLHTTGEICLSPVGLSMVTKMSPRVLVSTMMGGWFLSTAFAEYVAGLIAALTGVTGGGEDASIPVPLETVHVYGSVFGKIAVASAGAALLAFAITPLLKKWMHVDQPMGEGGASH